MKIKDLNTHIDLNNSDDTLPSEIPVLTLLPSTSPINMNDPISDRESVFKVHCKD